jgi:hypothetical protein
VPQPSLALALDIPADTLRQRPDVRVAQERVQAALARVSQADAARYPSLRLSGSWACALTLGALGDSASLVHSLLGSGRATVRRRRHPGPGAGAAGARWSRRARPISWRCSRP